MDCPAYSPDLNPIEHVWDALGRRIAARLHHPENTKQLKQMLIEEWVLLPQEMLLQLVLSMRRRWEATIAPMRSLTVYININESQNVNFDARCSFSEKLLFTNNLVALHFKYDFWHMTATAGSDVVQSGRPIFDDFFQHLWQYIGNNTANVVFQMVKRLWLIRIDNDFT
ncbi:transposable element Tcb1 transposase [Trichonephila clavipes]|nr:transposable element Tcb1 transposase [Trichonephila clavipes]